MTAGLDRPSQSTGAFIDSISSHSDVRLEAMAKCRVQILIQDRSLAAPGERLTQNYDIVEPFFADGPVTRKLAVLDFDPMTGALLPPLTLVPPKRGNTLFTYEGGDDDDLTSRSFLALNAFGVVTRTMRLYESPEVLGRDVTWGFDGSQLMILPRAGRLDNAWYERESRSLQFFVFDAVDRQVYLSLSRDIVAHETAHAILDGLAPDLYHSVTPQGLAIHEGVADITAALIALSSGRLRDTELLRTDGNIAGRTAFSNVAEEFGRARDPAMTAEALRSLVNERSLNSAAGPDYVRSIRPHQLSQVLTGALYKLFVAIYEERAAAFLAGGLPKDQAQAKGLGVAAERFGAVVLRALDYLPPGELTFADLGRAILAADAASFPDASTEPRVIREEFVGRSMATTADLEVDDASGSLAFADQDLPTILDSDWAAYDFAHRHRDLIGAPRNAPLRVRPRQDVTKTYWHRDGERAVRELIFKVSWDRREGNPTGLGLPTGRQITVGSTLAVDWETRRVRAHVVSLSAKPHNPGAEARDDLLRLWIESDQLGLGVPSAVGDRGLVRAEISGDLMRVRSSLRMLDLAGRNE